MSDTIETLGGQQFRKEDKNFNPQQLDFFTRLIDSVLKGLGGKGVLGKMAQEAYDEGAIECPFTDTEKSFNEYSTAVESVCTLEAIRERVASCEGLTFSSKLVFDASTKAVCQRIGLEHVPTNIKTTLNSVEIMRERKQLAMEGITDWIRKAWEAIMKFLTKIWDWIKSLFGFTKKKPKDDLAKITQLAVSDCNKMLESFARFEHELSSQLDRVFDEAGINELLEGKEVFAENSHISKRVVPKKDGRTLLREAIQRQNRKATEEISADRVSADNIAMVLNEIRGLEPCFASGKSRYLLTGEMVHRHGGDIRDVVSATSSLYNVALGFQKLVKNNIFPVMEKASQALNKSDMDFGSFYDAIAKYPTVGVVRSAFGGEATTKDGVVLFNDVPGFIGMHFSCVGSIDDIAEAMGKGGVGQLAKVVAFSRGANIMGAEGAYIELAKTQSDLKICQQQASLLFEAEIEIAKIAEAYESHLEQLKKACEKASKYEDETTADAATRAVRVLLHTMQAYVNAPLATLDHLLTNSIDALCDYTNDSFVCLNPVTAARLMM